MVTAKPTDEQAADEAADQTAEPTDETVEHLQVAAREMLAAARSFLNIVEDVVTDRDKLTAVTAQMTELFGTAGQSIATFADRFSSTGGGRPSSDGPGDEPATARPRVRRVDVE